MTRREVWDTFPLMINQGERECMVLAVLGEQALIEYQMPAGSSALAIIPAEGDPFATRKGYRSVSYPSLPLKWLRAVVEQYEVAGYRWIAQPQSCARKIGSAREELALRRAPNVSAGNVRNANMMEGVENR